MADVTYSVHVQHCFDLKQPFNLGLASAGGGLPRTAHHGACSWKRPRRRGARDDAGDQGIIYPSHRGCSPL